MSSLKDRLREVLREFNYTEKQFTSELGVSDAYVRNIAVSVSIDKLTAIADMFPSVSIEWLVIGRGEMLRTPSNLTNIRTGHSSTVNSQTGTTNNYGDSSEVADKRDERDTDTLNRVLEIMSTRATEHEAQLNKIINDKNEQLKAKDEQIDRLLQLIVTSQGKKI